MRKNNKLVIFLYIFVLSFIISFIFIRFCSKKYGDVLISYGEGEAKRVITLIVNNSIYLDKYKNININNFFSINTDSNGNIKSIDLNSYSANNLLDMINKDINNNLMCLENGNIDNMSIKLDSISSLDYNNFKNGFVYSVPIGYLFGNGLVNNLGPNIPVKVILISDVVSSISNEVKDYGINNAMIEISVNVKVSALINMLFSSKRIDMNISRVIFMKIIQGNIPEYYFKGNN